MAEPNYPRWVYYPNRERPPQWVTQFVEAVAEVRGEIDSSRVTSLTSDRVLAHLRLPLEALGFSVETDKTRGGKIRRPVLFGDQGEARVTYEVDAVHDDLGVLVEVEAGRGARGNAVYRDIVRTSLVVGVKYLALGVMLEYHHQSGGKPVVVQSYREAKDLFDAIFTSGRLSLPFEGVLLFGY